VSAVEPASEGNGVGQYLGADPDRADADCAPLRSSFALRLIGDGPRAWSALPVSLLSRIHERLFAGPGDPDLLASAGTDDLHWDVLADRMATECFQQLGVRMHDLAINFQDLITAREARFG
jgi:hypothetical protein